MGPGVGGLALSPGRAPVLATPPPFRAWLPLAKTLSQFLRASASWEGQAEGPQSGARPGRHAPGGPLEDLVDRASPTPTGQFRVETPRVCLLLATVP